MLKTNTNRLVQMAVQGCVAYPLRFQAFEMDSLGKGHALPSVGGITYNVQVGDAAFGWQGDHIEPGVSVLLDHKNRSSKESQALQFLACAGNQARVISGDAKGSLGTVIGHHGGVEHLVLDFDQKTLKKLSYQDKVLIHAVGQGLEIEGMKDIRVYNLDPRVLKHWKITKTRASKLRVPVAAVVPACLMGSGIGHADPGTGDYDITTQDPKMVKKHGLEKLRFGDFVAIEDADNTYGRHYYKGAVTIGIVIHSDSILSGHGPGVATIMSSRTNRIIPTIDSKANLAQMLKIGRFANRVRNRQKGTR